MEPSDFDKLIQAKLAEKNSIHANEIQKAKPFIWTAIQKELNAKVFLFPWYQVAAAFILLLIGSSFLFYSMQLNHQTEISKLNLKVESLKQYYNQQTNVIIQKSDELLTICDEVDQLELAVKELHENEPIKEIRELIVYRSDTVYVDRVEQITQYIPLIDSIGKPEELNLIIEDNIQNESVQQIYPDYKKNNSKPAENELLKFKISAYSFQ
jgi:hypothetical protein